MCSFLYGNILFLNNTISIYSLCFLCIQVHSLLLLISFLGHSANVPEANVPAQQRHGVAARARAAHVPLSRVQSRGRGRQHACVPRGRRRPPPARPRSLPRHLRASRRRRRRQRPRRQRALCKRVGRALT